ncbi:glycosyltransferase family 4 protein [Aspergillus luchuensis CBS 106.47]|uniref:Glycosyltransferase family 4 protein n=1 Tax=Aspergillus luchuensis (strain CBS 106.47) TaxID=1137211 RepID=A0A1M3TFJ4_ASPLC|nr:glycosyltransferase family 4 protein [Aspergillus luchuensis CBS 106.47]
MSTMSVPPTTRDTGTERRTSLYELRRVKTEVAENDWTGPPLNVIYAGVAARFHLLTGATIAVAVRDSTYLLDYAQFTFSTSSQGRYQAEITQFIVDKMREYQEAHGEKFIGLAMPTDLAERCPDLCARLWSELDVIPIVLRKAEEKLSWGMFEEQLPRASLDELTESIARKCIRFFGPTHAPVPEIGGRGLVEVDAAFHVQIARLADYQKTVGTATWAAIQKYASDLQKRRVKIAFFSATPQGGGVALMRHAMVRFAKVLGVDLRWYVPRPRHGIFRITKNNHNILQGVAPPGVRFTATDRDSLRDWVIDNAERYWFKGTPLPPWLDQFAPHVYKWASRHGAPPPAWFEKNGPLMPPWEGGADVVVIDDPQMPWLIPLIKARTPDRPVIFRSHIQIRSDLVDTPGTPQAEAWGFLWEAIKESDIFVSHPVRAFVPQTVPRQKLGYLPASTDCLLTDIVLEDYIVQVARFDPSKGIPDVLISYEKFHKHLSKRRPDLKPPKLLICGHGSVDDPDGAIVYDAALEYIEQHLEHIRALICVMRIGPSDQMLHALLSRAKIALQLSTREGFEVKVSEALHMGKPVIATLAGGIPLQIQHGKNGFLVKPGDTDTVSEHLFSLYTDHEMYDRFSKYAASSVSDEVSNVGNTLSWLYLASRLSNGENIEPNGRWINDMAREDAGEPYGPEEYRLERTLAA